MEVIAYLVDARGQVAGALAGHDEFKLARLANRLIDRGLVFAYDRGRERTYTAHPFLRDYFRGLLGVPSTEVHEIVRGKLAPSLEQRPSELPTQSAILERYEELIEHTRLAGRTQEAFDLYWNRLGGYHHLGTRLGEYVRASCSRDADRRRAGSASLFGPG